MEQLPRSETLGAAFAPEAGTGLPDRLPWPLAALAIGGLSLLLWVATLAGLRALV
jgi:hypothetical protein